MTEKQIQMLARWGISVEQFEEIKREQALYEKYVREQLMAIAASFRR